MMKKIIAVFLMAVVICTAAGCSQNGSGDNESKTEASNASEQSTKSNTKAKTGSDKVDAVLSKLKAVDFGGIVYAEKGGREVFSYSSGKLYNDVPIKMDTPMPIGSVSKQFCAAAVMILQEKGKLSVNDKLDKYYPEYKEASKITLHQMLCHRSGIPNFDENTFFEDITYDHTDEENTKIMLKWVFEQPLLFEPDTDFTYSNLNFTLLSNIVEKVSGESYIAFLRENIFKPLGMEHTGSVDELDSSPEWAKGFSYVNDDFVPVGRQPGLCKGGGDIVSTASDMTLWMKGLSSGKVVSEESYKAMTSDYTNTSDNYGYGLYVNFAGGVGHLGSTGHFTACDCIVEKDGLTIFMASNSGSGKNIITNQLFILSSALRES